MEKKKKKKIHRDNIEKKIYVKYMFTLYICNSLNLDTLQYVYYFYEDKKHFPTLYQLIDSQT